MVVIGAQDFLLRSLLLAALVTGSDQRVPVHACRSFEPFSAHLYVPQPPGSLVDGGSLLART